jgi:pilus assembly protein Flp/PilA
MSILRKLLKDQTGATAIEYGLIAALISVAAIAAFTAVGSGIIDTLTAIKTNMD